MLFEICKLHLSGMLKGISNYETMKFVDMESAFDWAVSVSKNPSVPYTILTLFNQKNNTLYKI